MKEEYVFPENNWYIEITDQNIELINNWKIQQKWNKDIYKNNYKYVYYDGVGRRGRKLAGGWEITTSQFKQYVLNINEESVLIEDYTYMIELLNKLNIK